MASEPRSPLENRLIATLLAIAAGFAYSPPANAVLGFIFGIKRGPGVKCRLNDAFNTVYSQAFEKFVYERPPLPARKIDPLELAAALPEGQKTAYAEWVGELRGEDPPIRGREVYERVVLSAALHGGNRAAMLDTWIPYDEPEGVLPWISERISGLEPCPAGSLCRKLFKDPPLARLEQIRAGMKDAIARARETGFITYGDYLDQAHAAMVLADFAAPVPAEPKAMYDVESFFKSHWLPGHGRTEAESFEAHLSSGRERLRGSIRYMIPTLTTRPMSRAEVTVPGHPVSPLELIATWSYVDKTNAPPTAFLGHDLGHGERMARADGMRKDHTPEPVDFGDVRARLRKLREWQAVRGVFDRVAADFPEFKGLLEDAAFKVRHEDGDPLTLQAIAAYLAELAKKPKYKEQPRLAEFAYRLSSAR